MCPRAPNQSPTCSGHRPTSDPASYRGAFEAQRTEQVSDPRPFSSGASPGLPPGGSLRAVAKVKGRGHTCAPGDILPPRPKQLDGKTQGQTQRDQPALPCCPPGTGGACTPGCGTLLGGAGRLRSGEHPPGPTSRHQALHWDRAPLTDWDPEADRMGRSVTGSPLGVSVGRPTLLATGPTGQDPRPPRVAGQLQEGHYRAADLLPFKKSRFSITPDSWEDDPAKEKTHLATAALPGGTGTSPGLPQVLGTLRTNCSPPPREPPPCTSLHFMGSRKKFGCAKRYFQTASRLSGGPPTQACGWEACP